METGRYDVWREALGRLSTQLDRVQNEKDRALITGQIAIIMLLRDLTRRVDTLETDRERAA